MFKQYNSTMYLEIAIQAGSSMGDACSDSIWSGPRGFVASIYGLSIEIGSNDTFTRRSTSVVGKV